MKDSLDKIVERYKVMEINEYHLEPPKDICAQLSDASKHGAGIYASARNQISDAIAKEMRIELKAATDEEGFRSSREKMKKFEIALLSLPDNLKNTLGLYFI